MALCSTCEAFDIQPFRSAPFSTLGVSLAAVEKSAQETTCALCHLLYNALAEERRKLSEVGPVFLQLRKLRRPWIHMQMSKDNELSDVCAQAEPLNFNRMDLFIADRHYYNIMTKSPWELLDERFKVLDSDWPTPWFRVLADPGSPAAQSQDVKGTYLGDDPRSQHHLDAITHWLDGCQQHPACARTTSGMTDVSDDLSAELPTRCLYLQGDVLRLESTLGRKAAYVTLSHRWSQETQMSMTTVQNMEQRMLSIVLEDLPQTFQDAIYVTRQLGIPYLWIDSLCIIQDGDRGEDWKTEALKMGEYYQRARLTICAACDSSLGFLKARPPMDMPLVRLPYRNRAGSCEGSFFLQQRPRPPWADYAGSAVFDYDLLSRGWVFQEWLLSRRVLLYTPNQIFFECQSEDLRNECQEGAQVYSKHILLKKKICRREFDTLELWSRIIEHYSALELTKFVSDRLIALAGIAKETRLMIISEISDIRGTDVPRPAYVSGWWLVDIHYGLIWEPLGVLKPIPRSDRMSIPTWSWAHWPGPVQWRSRGARMEPALQVTRIISAKEFWTGIKDEEPMGLDVDNTFCCLELRAKLSLVLLCAPLDHYRTNMVTTLAEITGVSTDDFDPLQANSRWCGIASPDSPNDLIGWADIDRDFVPFLQKLDLRSERAILQVLHVSTQAGVKHGAPFGRKGLTHEVYVFLAIMPTSVDARRPNRYERIGLGRIYKQDYFKDSVVSEVELG